MKKLQIILFTVFGHIVFAQSFTESMNTSFDGVRTSTMAFADVDGDNDQDVLISGWANSGSFETSLYLNNGKGEYTKVSDTPFQGVQFGSIAFADVDGDNDQDVHISGTTDPGLLTSSLYLNDGEGNYTESIDDVFDEIRNSASAFADVDGDGDQDFLVTGSNIATFGITKLYINNGFGSLKEDFTTPFSGLVGSSIAFADVDGDNDLDLLITGSTGPSPPPGPVWIANLYINDGEGNFTLMNGTPFEPCVSSNIAFADIDGDNDQDVLITGVNGGNPINHFSKLYVNDGSGNFSEILDTPFEILETGSAAFEDVDGDNDQDLLITGKMKDTSPSILKTKLYINDGSGTFSEIIDTPFEGVYFSAIAFSDVDGDNDKDLMITGWGNDIENRGVAKLYINQSLTSSLDVNESSIEFKLHPNPVIGEALKIHFTTNEPKRITVSLIDIHGQTLKQVYKQIYVGENSLSLDVLSFPKGIYFIKLDDRKIIRMKKVIIL